MFIENEKFEERINNILIKDKFESSEYICSILKGEIENIVKCYLILIDDVIVRFKKNSDFYTFNVEIKANRIKPFGYLPKNY